MEQEGAEETELFHLSVLCALRALLFKPEMMAAHSALLRKFTDLAFDESAEARWQESRPAEADNMDVGPATETDLQGDLMETSGDPF